MCARPPGREFRTLRCHQSISEGRDSLLIGTVPAVLPVRVLDGVQRLAHDGSGCDLVNLRYIPLAAGDPAILAGPAECVQDAGRWSPQPLCRYSRSPEPKRSIRTSTVVIDAPSGIDPFLQKYPRQNAYCGTGRRDPTAAWWQRGRIGPGTGANITAEGGASGRTSATTRTAHSRMADG
jgi:hypothetical protein